MSLLLFGKVLCELKALQCIMGSYTFLRVLSISFKLFFLKILEFFKKIENCHGFEKNREELLWLIFTGEEEDGKTLSFSSI